MSLVIPNVAEDRLLLELLDGGTAREDWSMRLYKTNVTPAETDTAASYTVADFTAYVNKTLTRTVNNGVTWATIAQAAPSGGWSAEAAVAESRYVAQVWSPGSSQTVYGMYLIGATSTLLIGAEIFSSAKALESGDTLTVTPRFGLA